VAKRKLRMLLSYTLMFVVFNALSDGQASGIVGDSPNLEMASLVPAPGVATPSESSSNSQAVTCNGNQLKVSANDSTLASVLTEIQKCTGVKIDMPEGAAASRVFDNLGPGPAGEVLASLLTSTGYDYIIGFSQADPAKVEKVLLMARQDDAPRGALPDNAPTPDRLAHPVTHEDGASAAPHAAERVTAPIAGPETTAARVTPAAPAERIAASADRSPANNRAATPTGATQGSRAKSESTPSYVRFRPAEPAETIGQAGIPPRAGFGGLSRRDELAGLPADAYFVRDPRGSGVAGPILVFAIVRHPALNGDLAAMRFGNGRPAGYDFSDAMDRYAGSSIPAATQALRVRTESPLVYSISPGALGEAIWQADLRLEFVVPLTLAIVILVIQMVVRALMKTWIVLLMMPSFVIGAIGAICLMHYNPIVTLAGSVIALHSIYGEAVAIRLFCQEHSHLGNETERRRFQTEEAN